jgi:hypothetical protein
MVSRTFTTEKQREAFKRRVCEEDAEKKENIHHGATEKQRGN